MYTTQNFAQVTAVTIINYMARVVTQRKCFLNALRLVKFLHTTVTFDQMKGPW